MVAGMMWEVLRGELLRSLPSRPATALAYLQPMVVYWGDPETVEHQVPYIGMGGYTNIMQRPNSGWIFQWIFQKTPVHPLPELVLATAPMIPVKIAFSSSLQL